MADAENARGGPLVIIGGHEDKKGDRAILKQVAERVGGGRLVIATIASGIPDEYFREYGAVFAELGVSDTVELYVKGRCDALDPEKGGLLAEAAGIFFTGGDQLRISSQIGDTPVERALLELHARGGVIAGTSAGASVMGETMLIAGSDSDSPRIGDINVAPGLALLHDVIVDQHFAERGRIGRLLGAVSRNPRMLGIGIDENTAIVVESGEFSVIGEGGVTVVDASEVTHSNIAEAHPNRALSMHGVRLHVLSAGDHFDLAKRTAGVDKAGRS
jgi:cyanophycinase